MCRAMDPDMTPDEIADALAEIDTDGACDACVCACVRWAALPGSAVERARSTHALYGVCAVCARCGSLAVVAAQMTGRSARWSLRRGGLPTRSFWTKTATVRSVPRPPPPGTPSVVTPRW